MCPLIPRLTLSFSICLALPACLSSSLLSQRAVKGQALVCVVWLHSDTSHPEVSSVQWTRFPDPAKAAQSLLSHCCDNSHRPPTGVMDTRIQVRTIHSADICVCVLYLSIIPGNAFNIIPGPHENCSVFIHNILLEQTLIREVHHIICYTHSNTRITISILEL